MPVRKFRCLRKYAKPWKRKMATKMSRNPTAPERILWERLKEKKLGVWFHKQKIVLGYILDFWCPSAGLCVEVDGPMHLLRKAWDAKRDAVLARRGIQTMRFTAAVVENSTNAVETLIRSRVRNRLK